MRTFARFTLLLAALTGFAASAAKYQNIVIAPFQVAKAVSFPADFEKALVDTLVHQFIKGKMFSKVVGPGDTAASPPGRTLKLTGLVTHVDPGSQTGRWAGGPFGLGKATITAHVRFLDAASGQVKLESDVTGVYKGSIIPTSVDTLAGGEAINAARALAKEIVKVAKKKL
jgi:hypothetical protein